MTPDEIYGLLENRPDVLLALSLSAPPASGGMFTSPTEFTVQLRNDEIIVRSPVSYRQRVRETCVMCSKESIANAILLHEVWRMRENERNGIFGAIGL